MGNRKKKTIEIEQKGPLTPLEPLHRELCLAHKGLGLGSEGPPVLWPLPVSYQYLAAFSNLEAQMTMYAGFAG